MARYRRERGRAMRRGRGRRDAAELRAAVPGALRLFSVLFPKKPGCVLSASVWSNARRRRVNPAGCAGPLAPCGGYQLCEHHWQQLDAIVAAAPPTAPRRAPVPVVEPSSFAWKVAGRSGGAANSTRALDREAAKCRRRVAA